MKCLTRFPPAALFGLTAFALLVTSSRSAVCQQNASDEPQRQRIVEKEEESTAKKVVMFPVRVLIFPFWLTGKGIEASLLTVEENNLVEKSRYYQQRIRELGVSIRFGVGYDGAGFGAGVDWNAYRGPVSPTISAAASVKLYQVYALRLDFSRALGNRLGVALDLRYKNLPQEDFFGIGRDTRLEDRTNYKREATELALNLSKSIIEPVRVTADIAYDDSNIFGGEDDRFPSTDDVFGPEEAPGLDTGAELFFGGLALELSTLDYPGAPTKGVLVRVLGGIYEDLEDGPFNFSRYSFEFQGYVPLLGRGNRFGPRSLLGVRLLAEFNEPRSGGEVPFFRMPHIGGSSTLRGFREFRFTDRNAVVTNVEYRYQIQQLIQAVIFWDEGQVFSESGDFDFSHFRSSFGGGLRVVFRHDAFARLEVGRGAEETRVYFKFGKAY